MASYKLKRLDLIKINSTKYIVESVRSNNIKLIPIIEDSDELDFLPMIKVDYNMIISNGYEKLEPTDWYWLISSDFSVIKDLLIEFFQKNKQIKIKEKHAEL